MSKKKRNIPVKKNKQYTEKIIDYTHEGLGVAKVDGYPIFIEEAMVDELVTFKVVKTGKNFGFGIVKDILEANKERVDPIGKVYSQTGTMDLQHMSYAAQLAFKKERVQEAIRKIGHIEDVDVKDTIGMNFPYEYRNKAQVPLREDGYGNLYTGFFRKRSHDVVPIDNFVIQHPAIDEAIITVRNILEEFGIRGYVEENHRGDIKHILVRRGQFTKEVMITLVSRTKNLRYKEEITKRIVDEVPNVVSVVRNINIKRTNVILGRDFEVLYGEDAYTDTLFNLTFKISHQSFFQVNSIQTEKLYQTAIDYADLSRNDIVIDAYSGIGTMTLVAAQKARQVYGIEVVKSAVKNAKENAKLNNIDNVTFEVGKAEEWMVNQAKKGLEIDVMIVDPPRKGLDKTFINAALETSPKRIVYVSCNPSTLARDLKLFTEGGYELKKVQPVDMFPQTYHVECVVLMEKK